MLYDDTTPLKLIALIIVSQSVQTKQWYNKRLISDVRSMKGVAESQLPIVHNFIRKKISRTPERLTATTDLPGNKQLKT